MTPSRPWWLFAALALSTSACMCARAPVNNVLKAEGEACAADEECESSLCDQLPGKAKVCFRKCAVGCKPGDVCTSLAVNDRFACVPEKPGLCQGCELNIDCPYPGDRCVALGDAKVCARDCAFDGQCPASYRCADATDSQGQYAPKQCQPISGTCECIAATAGQTVPCAESNSFGTCNGVKTCRPPNGYDACSAPVPAQESCNGRDDDCNGQTDENLGDTSCGIGECRRTVSNCLNGTPQTCQPGQPQAEVCDGKDNDCNGIDDDGFDKQTSLLHCGACNQLCVRPNAVAVCDLGNCRIGQCLPGWTNADMIDANGCEYPCTVTNGGVEICDGLDNNCNGFTDEGFNLVSDPLNCGQCNLVCNVSGGNIATYACNARTCAVGTCASGWDNCDQSYANGCEKNVAGDVANCGACNNVCNSTNGTPTCASGQCGITCTAPFANCDGALTNGCEVNTDTDPDHCGGCPTVCPSRANATRVCELGGCGYRCVLGFVDLNGLASDGCEYTCTATGVDDPDDLSVDQNCDGIDGDESRAIFVAKTGNDAWPGTKTQPKLTVQAGLNAASTARPHVYVSVGTYTEAITLRDGMSIYGGYNATNNWQRSAANVVTLRNATAASSRIVAVAGTNLTAATTIAYVTITAADTNVVGVSTYGLHCVSCPGLRVRSATIHAGSAGAGAAGTTGGVGTNGTNGTGGNNGSCDGTHGAGGAGATSACGRAGGRGGDGGPEGNNAGQAGATGQLGTPGGAGGAGCSQTCGGCSGRPGANGSDGSAGSTGGHGTGGTGGTTASNYFVAASGTTGSAGTAGNGGGGGGGGGGQGGACVNDGGGNGGGGGGSAGCGGSPGTGGAGGGSSIGVFLVNSTGATIQSCAISSGAGGSGGAGGNGGSGGSGGNGGLGATVCTGEVGAGGNGGRGGNGGQGGAGGGGAGGVSYAIYRVGTTLSTAGNALTPGVGGNGGGSAGGGAAVGAAGASGSVF